MFQICFFSSGGDVFKSLICSFISAKAWWCPSGFCSFSRNGNFSNLIGNVPPTIFKMLLNFTQFWIYLGPSWLWFESELDFPGCWSPNFRFRLENDKFKNVIGKIFLTFWRRIGARQVDPVIQRAQGVGVFVDIPSPPSHFLPIFDGPALRFGQEEVFFVVGGPSKFRLNLPYHLHSRQVPTKHLKDQKCYVSKKNIKQ